MLYLTSNRTSITNSADLDTAEGLHRALLKANYNEPVLVVMGGIEYIWNEKLGHCSKYFLKISVPLVQVVSSDEVLMKNYCNY